MKRYASLLVFIFALHFMPLMHCMDQVLMDNDSLVWTALLSNGVQWFDFLMIRSLLVSKKMDLILQKTTPYRKEYLKKRFGLDDVAWHPYGAMCGVATHYTCPQCFPDKDVKKAEWGLHARRFYLYNDYHQPCGVYYSSFHSCLPRPVSKKSPYIDTQGVFCFYNYTNHRCKHYSSEQEHHGSIMKYEWQTCCKPWNLCLNNMQCMTNIQNEKSELIELKVLLEFPLLLDAFFKSSCVQKVSAGPWERHGTEIYGIEGVTIPENYRYHQPYFSEPCYQSFDDLPMPIRMAIIRKHIAQRSEAVIPKKEKNKKMLSCFGK
jgi:hypothetical protein